MTLCKDTRSCTCSHPRTAGALVANHTEASTLLVHEVSRTAAMLGTTARPDQLHALVNNHVGVEQRTQLAYQVALRQQETHEGLSVVPVI